MNLKTITSRLLLCLVLLLTNACAEEPLTTDIFAVTPENCGEMTLEKCKETMAWAKARSAQLDADIQASQARIDSMHEEALGILSETTKEK